MTSLLLPFDIPLHVLAMLKISRADIVEADEEDTFGLIKQIEVL